VVFAALALSWLKAVCKRRDLRILYISAFSNIAFLTLCQVSIQVFQPKLNPDWGLRDDVLGAG
jgi:hypothetical protein